MYHAEVQDIETAEGLLGFAPDGRLILHEEYHNHPQMVLSLDRYMEVLTPSGQILLRNAKLHGQDLGGATFPGEGLFNYHERRVRLPNGARLLLISHIHSIDNRPLLIRLAYSSEPIEQGVRRFVALLLLAVPPALLLAGLAGYRMARRHSIRWTRWRSKPKLLQPATSGTDCPWKTLMMSWAAWRWFSTVCCNGWRVPSKI